MLINDSAKPEVKRIVESIAADFHVVPDIHELDFIFQYSLSRNKNVQTVVRRYFERGAYAARKLASFTPNGQALSILDFASGYGCVSRHLPIHFPQGTRVNCCDIHPEAVSFIANRLGIEAFLSHEVPEKLQNVEPYDVVFALSFLSHLPEKTWTRWLKKLLSLLSENGMLVFTTHGYASLMRGRYPLHKFTGFKFSPESEQKDLSTAEYGNTIVSAGYVVPQIPPGFRLVYFREADWENYQDVYVVARTY